MRLLIAGAAAFVLAAISAIWVSSTSLVVLAFGVALTCIELAVLRWRAGGFTAAMLPVISVNTILLAAIFVWPTVEERAIVSVRLPATTPDLRDAAFIGMMFSAAVTVGALFFGRRMAGSSIFDELSRLRLPTGGMLIAGYGVIGVTVFAFGDGLLHGAVYVSGTGPAWAISVANILTPVALAAVCVAAFKPGKLRLVAILGVAIWSIVLFGRASRLLAAIPFFLLLGGVIGRPNRIRVQYFVIAGAASLVLLQLPLALRLNAGGVGILVLGEELISNAAGVFAAFDIGGILGNILFAGPLTAVVSQQELSQDSLWVSMNPGLGDVVDWDRYRPTLMYDETTPFNAIGELAAHGGVTLVAYGLLVGFALAGAEIVASRIRGSFRAITLLLVIGVTAFYSVSILQYQLRTSTRLIWYIVGGVLLMQVFAIFLQRREVRKKGDTNLAQSPESLDLKARPPVER